MVAEPEDGFDDGPTEEHEIEELEILRDQESEMDVTFQLPGVMAKKRGFESLDGVNLVEEFDERACLMKTVPRFSKGPYRIALRRASDGDQCGRFGAAGTRVETLPAPSLVVPPSWPEKQHQQKLWGRFEKFNSGWISWKRIGRLPKKQLKLVDAGIAQLRMISRGGSAEL